MKSERLMGLISEIDPELIESADVRHSKMNKTPVIIGLVAAAACITVIVSVGYYAKTVNDRKLKQASDVQSISTEPVVTNIASYISADTPKKKVEVDVNSPNSYGITLNLTVNDKEDYSKYYTYADYTVYKKTDEGKVPVGTIVQDQIQYFVSPEENTKDGEKIVIEEKKKVPLEDKETHMNITWIDKYGVLEEGEYYIEIKVYNENPDVDPIQFELPFTINE